MHLESVQDNSPNYVTMTSSIDHLHNLLNHYQSKLKDAVEEAENQSIPYEPIRLKNLLLQGFNIGVNDYRKDDVYYHFYFKKTDHNKRPLPHEEWRLRAEVRLSNLDHALEDLRNVVKTGFKKLTFTQLNDTATLEQRKIYSLYIRPYGQKLPSPILKNGHYRDFKRFICTNKNLNERLRESVKNLSNKF